MQPLLPYYLKHPSPKTPTEQHPATSPINPHALRFALSRMGIKRCPVPKCTYYLRETALMCRYHWHFVPANLVLALRKWSRFNRADPAYGSLCQQAIEAVAPVPLGLTLDLKDHSHPSRLPEPEYDPHNAPF